MDLESIPSGEFTLERGDRILFYTDGVTECEDPAENMYEIEGLTKAFQLCGSLAPEKLLEFLSADLDRFSQGGELTDDRTLLLVSVED
jgi:sigma-B regulation protein RsbU (phosphoserine phosphatase)